MRKSKHLPSFILILTLIGILGAPFSLSELAAQDRIPACPPPGKKQKTIKPLREMNWANDTVSVQFSFPAAFRGMGRNEIVDSIALLTPVFERRRRRTYAVNPRTATASETIRRYAKEHRLLVWDMYDVVGGKRRACVNWTEAKLMRPDHVHYLPEGYILQGNLLYQALINAYNDYVSH